METYAIPLAAMAIALVSFVATQFRGLQAADRDHVIDLSSSITLMKQELIECQRMKGQLESDIMQLRGENLRLYQRVDSLEHKVNNV